MVTGTTLAASIGMPLPSFTVWSEFRDLDVSRWTELQTDNQSEHRNVSGMLLEIG